MPLPVSVPQLQASIAPAFAWTLLLAAPVMEEVLFRGGLQEALLRRWPSPAGHRAALWISSLAFATAHSLARPWILALAVLPAGLCLSALYQVHRSLPLCIAAHAALNLVWLLGFPFLTTPLAAVQAS